MAVQSTLQDSLKNEMHAPEVEGRHWSALQKATKTSRRYLAGFDALRFCAATMVMMYHLSFWIWAGSDQSQVRYPWAAPFTWFGFVAVEVFFTLSGFVIAYSAESATPFSFASSRLGRLVPGSLICASLTALACGFLHEASWRSLAHEWLHSAWLPVKHPFIDGSYWTLPIELSFYTLVLLLLLTKASKYLPGAIGTIGIFSSLTWLGLSLSHFFGDAATAAKAYHAIYALSTRAIVFLTLVPHGCFFAEGVFLWLFTVKGPTRRRAAVCLGCAVGGVLETYWHSQLELADIGMHFSSRFSSFTPCAIWTMSLGCILLSVYKNAWIMQRMKARSLKLLRIAGLTSYPLYLLHQRLGFLALERMHGHSPDLLNLGIVIAAMLGVSVLIALRGEPILRSVIIAAFALSERKTTN
jgi:peptidoglycan/LPS O-acetylase OafA/YrhL